MSDPEIENRASIAIIKWLMIWLNNGEIPTKHFDWSFYRGGPDGTWLDVLEILVECEVFLSEKIDEDCWDFETKFLYSEIESNASFINLNFEKLFSAFLHLGDFLNFLTLDKGEGFKIENEMSNLFEDLGWLGYCYSDGDLYFWRKKVYPVTTKLKIYSFWRPDYAKGIPTETWRFTKPEQGL